MFKPQNAITQVEFNTVYFNDIIELNTQYNSVNFINCNTKSTEGVDYSNLKFTNCKFFNCNMSSSVYKYTQFIDCRFEKCTFENSILTGMKIESSVIISINISKCLLHLASFINCQIEVIEFKPYIRRGTLQGWNGILNPKFQPRTIILDGNTHLEFHDFCKKEAIKDKFYGTLISIPTLIKPFSFLAIYTYGILTNYGTSFWRWLLCSTAIIFIYALVYTRYEKLSFNNEAITYSLRIFINFNTPESELKCIPISEACLGYFMLGILISILNSKLKIN